MTPTIKICGISTVEALDAAIQARADYIGMVFFPPSPRNVEGIVARTLAMRARQQIGRVGLFVDATDQHIAEGIDSGTLDAIQLHGEETPQRVAEIRSRFSLPVWKAIPIATASDVERADGYRGAADMLLFDAKTPKDAALPGGMGLRFDWSLLSEWKGRPGWGLAGGLNRSNVVEAVAQTRARLVDTSSGVETAPGVKSGALIHAFCEAARNA